MNRKKFGLLLMIVLVLTFGLKFSSSIVLNLGQILYNKDRKLNEYNEGHQSIEITEKHFEIAAELNSANLNAFRGAGLVAYSAGDKEKALDYWRKVNNIDEELTTRGDVSRRIGKFDDAIEWYDFALKLGAGHHLTPDKVAHSCQQALFSNDYDVCLDGSIFSSENLLIDSTFQSDTSGIWRESYSEQGNSYFTDCPDLIGQRCATIVVTDGQVDSGASIYQRIKLTSEFTYEFSTWLKVEADPDASWRPTYFQGLLDDEIRGYWPGYQYGSSDWQYFTSQFNGPDFDNGFGYFHPVRLHDNGQVWIHNPVLKVVDVE